MTLPALRPLVTKPSGLSEVPFEMEEEDDQEQNFDVPQSREEKPAAYPNGPICIYEAGVYLYFEPTAEQACTFDVIINVASEVKNPFTSSTSQAQKDIDARRIDGPPAESVDFATLSQRAKPVTSFGMDDSSPTTPKATPVMQTIQAGEMVIDGKTHKTPEYIHMPWEHNTDIVPDLYKLVKMMDEKVQQGKRVLIHCQCGVSRSASLIVAYGLYKDPQMSVQEAYDRAKKRSKWIGPNMNLIMQLQEFRNGLLRANDSRNRGFGSRSAGLNTSRSTGNNRYSAFESRTGSGSQTPRTAPLPPDSDISMQRASTGNMMAISPGPLSAPTGIFSAGFRRSWDASQSQFDASAQATPVTTPYVDPAGHIVPVLSITANDVVSPKIEIAPAVEFAPPQKRATLQLPSAVPNFSRQLPFRSQDDDSAEVTSSHLEVGQPAGLQPLSFGALRSPAVASFALSPSFAPQQSFGSDEIMSPIKTTFDNPWPSGYDSEPSSNRNSLVHEGRESPPTLASPRATEFHMAPLNHNGIDESYGLLSPRATSFDLSQPPKFGSSIATYDASDVASPVATQFPKDIFGKTDEEQDEEPMSPRAEEFHMSPFKPEVTVDEDPFGLTSPTRFDIPGNPFDRPTLTVTQGSETEERRPSFQAILPPSHQTFNGFASLDGTAQAEPIHTEPLALRTLGGMQPLGASPRVDSLSTAPETKNVPSIDSLPRAYVTVPKAPETPQTPKEAFLSTPSKGIKTRFSSPNLREQRKLHKLQTAMESKLPKKAPAPQHAADDIDALMSPRAEEFTRNPFHFEFQVTSDDNSPVSSNETIKDGRNGHDWTDPVPRQWTPEKATVDPRSPVQTGSSPITRNIWDVL
jgi:tyrosine-protein phosphatase